MKKLALLLALLMALALAACGGAAEEPQTEPEPETPAAAEPETPAEGLYTNGGLTLSVPEDYDPLVVVETPASSEEGVLFTVTEKASREFGQQQHPGEDWGDGWLFSIGTADEDVLHGMLAYDLSGAVPFAQGEDGTYYIFYHPTDVRFVRESYDIDPDSDDWKAWTALNEWAWTVQETFAGDNGLTPRTFTNTAPDMILNQVAYLEEPYTLTALDHGTLTPAGDEGAPYLEEMLEGVTFRLAEGAQRPDGEYIVLELPQAGERLDFFLADGNYVREVYDGEETLYQAVYPDGDKDIALAARAWYNALAQAGDAAA